VQLNPERLFSLDGLSAGSAGPAVGRELVAVNPGGGPFSPRTVAAEDPPLTHSAIMAGQQARRPTRRARPAPLLAPLLALLGLPAGSAAVTPPATDAGRGQGRTPTLSHEEAWKKLPRAEQGAGQPLPAWARALAATMPHTTAAMLELDFQHRARSPLEAKLRARMRWTAAHALGCAYSQAHAAADLLRAGARLDDIRALAGDCARLPERDRTALAFAHKMAVEPYAVTDEEVARLVRLHGEKQAPAQPFPTWLRV